jgi:hypothetical protein
MINKEKPTNNNNEVQTVTYEYSQNYDELDEYQLGHPKQNVPGFHDLPVQESESDDGDILEKIDNLLIENEEDYLKGNTQEEGKKASKK